ncbi:unnamed protein product [Bubo scandiacus]
MCLSQTLEDQDGLQPNQHSHAQPSPSLQPLVVMELRSGRCRVPQPLPPCPTVLLEEQAGPSCAVSPLRMKRQVPKEEGEHRISPQAPARGDFGQCPPMQVEAPTPWEGVTGQLYQHKRLCIHENFLHTPSFPLLHYHASGLTQRGANEEGFYSYLFPNTQTELKWVVWKERSRGHVFPPWSPCPVAVSAQAKVLHLPAGRHLSHLLGLVMPAKYPLPLQQQAMLHFPFFWGVQASAATRQGRSQGQGRGGLRLSSHLHPTGPSAGSTGGYSRWERCSRTRPPAPPARRPWWGDPATTPWSVPPAPAPGSTAAASRARHCALPSTTSAAHSAKTCRPTRCRCFALASKFLNRDAAWEEDGTFNDRYQQHSSCNAVQCLCLAGQEQLEEKG